MFQFLKKIFLRNKASQEDDSPSKLELLESGAGIFLRKKMYTSAIGLYATLVREKPTSSTGWYGIANALYCLAAVDINMRKLFLGYQCILRSIEEDQKNKYAKELHHWMLTKSPLQREDVSDVRPFRAAPQLITNTVGFNSDTLIQHFQEINAWMMRMHVIMSLENIEEQYVGDLFVSALNDPHEDVKMAVLKRIGIWGNREDVRSTLEEMVASEAWDELGPYLGIGILEVQQHYPEYESWSASLLEKIRDAWNENE